jgi:hypothetical protein
MGVSLAPEFITLLDTVSAATGTGTSRPIRMHGRDEVVFYFQSNGTTSGGTLVIEEAAYPDPGPVYAGTWSTVGSTINASSFTGTAQIAYHISPNAYSYLRVRIATDITGGGTVTVYAKIQ